jgi:hypothetical protein
MLAHNTGTSSPSCIVALPEHRLSCLLRELCRRHVPRWHGRLAGIQWTQRTMALTKTGIYFSKTGEDQLLDCIPEL